MSPRSPRLNARGIERVLQRHGFVLVSQKGSHRKWACEASGAQVIVPFHGGKDLPIGTLRQIMKASEVAADKWVE